MTLADLSNICTQNGLPLDQTQEALLDQYSKLLADWNSKINLISRKDEEHILDRHMLHSLALRMPGVCDYNFTDMHVADVGTGGGLPGIPIMIVTPSIHMTMIDSIRKKIVACNEMIVDLGLTNIRTVRGRAEELGHEAEHAHKYDAIVSRAVAPLDELAKLSHALLKPGGILLGLKGGDLEEEIERTKQMKFVHTVQEKPLRLIGYDDFENEKKMLVSVTFRT